MDTIQHQGIVESINGSHIRVRIMQTSSCAACSAKGHCSSADNKEKIVDIYESDEFYKKGDEVIICGTMSMGNQAVFIAFILPFIILIISLFVLMYLTNDNELLSALISLALLFPYYIIISLYKNRLKKTFAFTIKHINN